MNPDRTETNNPWNPIEDDGFAKDMLKPVATAAAGYFAGKANNKNTTIAVGKNITVNNNPPCSCSEKNPNCSCSKKKPE